MGKSTPTVVEDPVGVLVEVTHWGAGHLVVRREGEEVGGVGGVSETSMVKGEEEGES